jgi:hypothetical protein
MTIDTSFWGWPQYIVIVLLFLPVLVSGGTHGTTQVYKANAWYAAARFAVLMFMLAAGGFFR